MPWKGSEAVPQGNGPVLQQEEFGSNQPTLADIYRMVKEPFNQSNRKLNELSENLKTAIIVSQA